MQPRGYGSAPTWNPTTFLITHFAALFREKRLRPISMLGLLAVACEQPSDIDWQRSGLGRWGVCLTNYQAIASSTMSYLGKDLRCPTVISFQEYLRIARRRIDGSPL